MSSTDDLIQAYERRLADFEARLAAMARFFRERTLRWSVWICQDMLDPSSRRRESS